MRDEELDGVLRGDVEEIEPSSGFVASVMEAVRAEAEAPPPIPFPWVRAVPGLVAVSLLVVFFIVEFLRGGVRVAGSAEVARAVAAANGAGVGWILGALVLAFVSVRLAMRMAGARG